MLKNCSRCAMPLVCTADAACWCMTYPLVELNGLDDCLCATCLQKAIAAQVDVKIVYESAPEQALRCSHLPLIEGLDYVVENGLWVFSRWAHLKRGHCCGSSCRNCPYGYVSVEWGDASLKERVPFKPIT